MTVTMAQSKTYFDMMASYLLPVRVSNFCFNRTDYYTDSEKNLYTLEGEPCGYLLRKRNRLAILPFDRDHHPPRHLEDVDHVILCARKPYLSSFV